MGAMGYAKNKEPFQELARRLPLRVLESIAQEQGSENRRVTLQAMLLGAAGLLPSQCGVKFEGWESLAKLEEIWHFLDIESAMSYTDWRFFRMHPKNFPPRRLLAAGCLLDRYLEGGLLSEVLVLVTKAKPGVGSTALEDGFRVSNLIGQGRAREIVVNVVLPFSLAWAEVSSQPKLKNHALGLYRTYPPLVENKITRYLSKLFWGRVILSNDDPYFNCLDLGKDYTPRPWAVKGKGFARAFARP
jgi:hypothetical protein